MPSLTAQIVYHAAIALETAADKVVEADRIADLEALVLNVGSNILDVAYTLMAKSDGVVRSHVKKEVGMT